MITQLLTDEIRVDGGTQSRAEFDRDLVSEYSRAMHDGEKFPPMLVFHDGTHYWLADGFHRHAACVDIGLEFVDAEVREGSLRDAQLYSFSANASHGKRRTNADKRRAVQTMLGDAEWSQLSDREISRVCSVSHDFVSRQRKDSSLSLNDSDKTAERTYTTKHGTQARMNTANIGKRDEDHLPESKPEFEVLDALPKKEVKPSIEERAKLTIEGEVPESALNYDPASEPELTEEEIAEFQAEHEARLSEYLELAKSDDALGKALGRIDELSQKISKLEQTNVFLERQLDFRTNELNILKKRLAAINKAAAKKEAK